jgi:hypothetical protein
LEPALCEVYKNALIGKILIQTNDVTGEPEVGDILLTKIMLKVVIKLTKHSESLDLL